MRTLLLLFSKVKKDVGDIDILVNNAGIVTGKKLLECPDALIEKTMAVNIGAHFWVGGISEMRTQLQAVHVQAAFDADIDFIMYSCIVFCFESAS